MTIYRLKIVGVHYAVNPDSTSRTEETELMHQRTAQRLRELGEQRPPVALVPEPSNPVDPRAVMARVRGNRIGYVDKTQLDIVHSLLQSRGGKSLVARIDEVEARKHGWLYVAVEAGEEVPVEPLQKPEDAWREWESSLPVIAPDEAYFAREEAEAMLDEVLSKYPIMLVPSGFAPHSTQSSTESLSAPADDVQGENKEKRCDTPCDSVVNIDLIETYVRLWLQSALHDLSNEARLTREHYIMCLKQMTPQNTDPSTEGVPQNAVLSQEPLPRIRALVYELEKLRTAICGQKRSNLRVDKWWKELMQSEAMDRLWKTWMTRNTEGMEQGVNELCTPLRALPFDLYAFIDDRKLFFSRLHYAGVPRTKYWQIVSLMLLRERALRIMKVDAGARVVLDALEEEGCNETFSQVEGWSGDLPPHPEQEETKFLVTIPKELQTTEAKKILAKLQKKGILDEDLQPVGLSGAKKGVLAWELCDVLGIKTCWKTMGILWKCNGETIRKARDKGIMTDGVIEFTKFLKAIIH